MRYLTFRANNNLKEFGMKYLFLTVLITVFTSVGLGQNFSKLESIPLNDAEDCINAEPQVLECCNYLLSTPCVEDKKSMLAFQFVFKWMTETKSYTFKIGNLFVAVSNSAKSNKEITRRFLVSMVKRALTDNPEVMDEEFTIKYITTFAEYCENPKFKVPQSSFTKKMIKAKNTNTLDKFLRDYAD